jgi:uracil-DNA glycosylase family 4
MIVGEAPGEAEDQEGVPFVGKSGRHLEGVLDKIGVDMRWDCWMTNACVCHPPHNELDRFPKAVEYCRPNLLNALAEFKPAVIVLLGGVAAESLLAHVWRDDVGGISRWAGLQIPNHRPNAWICPTYHPSYLLRSKDPVLDGEFRRHLTAAFELSGVPWPDGPPDYPGRVETILDPAAAAARVRRYTGGLVAFDFEHNPLKPDAADADLVSCSICWEGEETIAFPWHGAVRDEVKNLLRNPDIGKIASNLKNEDRWCRAVLDVRVASWDWDTMLAAHALDPRGGVTGLKFQSFVRLGCPDYAHHITPFLIPREPGGYAPNKVRSVALLDLLVYNGLDSLLEFEVAKSQKAEMGV